MIQFTIEQFQNGKVADSFQFTCDQCNKTFYRTKTNLTSKRIMRKTDINQYLFNYKHFCSHKCHGLSRNTQKNFKCALCQKEIVRTLNHSKSINLFCNHSCAATYNNTHKKHGTRVSKFEKWVASKLPLLYPTLEFHFNRKDVINSELNKNSLDQNEN